MTEMDSQTAGICRAEQAELDSSTVAKNMYNEFFGFSEAPFNVTPDSRFFFVNPCYEEAFATLRYGIEARRGFIVMTGAPGTGKTTLLKRLTDSLDAGVQAACIFDPHLSFIELLRLTLLELGVSDIGQDRLTMMKQLYEHLMRQLENGRIVCLMIDEAQNLSMEMLEELRLLSNLETDSDKLIQIVFVAQPEFEKKLQCIELVQLKQRVALRCRLKPLEAHETGRYIESRLQTVHYARADLFDADSIERIGRYSRGIPRLINSICDNALLIAYTVNRRYILASDIDEAAQELELVEEQARPGPKAAAPESAKPFEAPPFEFQKEQPKPAGPAWVPPRDRDFEPRNMGFWEPSAASRPPERHRRGLVFLVFMITTVGTLFLFTTWQRPLSLPEVYQYLKSFTTLLWEIKPVAPVPPVQKPVPHDVQRVEPQRAPPDPAVSITAQNLEGDDGATPKAIAPERSEPQPQVRLEKPAKKAASKKIPPDKRLVSQRRSRGVRSSTRADDHRDLEVEVYRAIRDRAITGVYIASIDEGTVYLEGRVASTRQKLAAVRAALSVPGVANVRDRIVIR